jgi:hypothetical protein
VRSLINVLASRSAGEQQGADQECTDRGCRESRAEQELSHLEFLRMIVLMVRTGQARFLAWREKHFLGGRHSGESGEKEEGRKKGEKGISTALGPKFVHRLR